MTQIINNATETRSNIIEMLEAECGAWTAVYAADAQGNNASYNTCSIDALLESLGGYEFDSAEQVESLDLDTWAQDFDAETVESLRDTMEQGRLFVANFRSADGLLSLLIWD